MILLASASQEMLARWKFSASGFNEVQSVTDSASLDRQLARRRPQILLLDHDLPGLNIPEGISDLAKSSPDTRIICLTPTLSEDGEWQLFRAGARGCCPRDIEPAQLQRVVGAVRQGELWMRRTLTSRLLNELGIATLKKQQIKQAASDLLRNITRREHEIATLVGNGESNKQIARRLEITERTVKAHLTEIFRKLNVADRLKLALLVTGSADLHHRA